VKYSLDYNPPAPSLKVKFARPFSDRSVELQAKLDTGADMTVLPQHAVGELRLIPASRISVSSFNGREDSKYTYFVNLSFEDYECKMLEVISGRRRDALLGRDVLNKLKTLLDGKTLSFSLHDP